MGTHPEHPQQHTEQSYADAVTAGDEHHVAGPVVVDVEGPVATIAVTPTSWTAGQVPVPAIDAAGAVQVAPLNHARSSLTLTNLGPATAYLSPSQGAASPSIGYPLAVGATLTMTTRAAVWAVCASGQAAVLGVAQQHRDG